MKRQMKLMLVLLTAGMSQAALGEEVKYDLTTVSGLSRAFDAAYAKNMHSPAARHTFRVSMGGNSKNPGTTFNKAIKAVFAKQKGGSAAAAVADKRAALAAAKKTSDATIAQLKALVKDGQPDIKSIGLSGLVDRYGNKNRPKDINAYINGIHTAGVIDGLRRSEVGKKATQGISDRQYEDLFHDLYEKEIEQRFNAYEGLKTEVSDHEEAVEALQAQIKDLEAQNKATLGHLAELRKVMSEQAGIISANVNAKGGKTKWEAALKVLENPTAAMPAQAEAGKNEMDDVDQVNLTSSFISTM